jgi:mannitol/fructose-specific phosphotransferase system IIA component (Ntr-type)
LKILARISRLLKKPTFREALMQARSKNDIYRAIADEEKDVIG